MSDIVDSLIFDRVQADIDAMTDKAYIDYQDLNRVEDAIKWVSYVLNCYGYRNTIIEGTLCPLRLTRPVILSGDGRQRVGDGGGRQHGKHITSAAEARRLLQRWFTFSSTERTFTWKRLRT